jgi:PPM family protein phosphatase
MEPTSTDDAPRKWRTAMSNESIVLDVFGQTVTGRMRKKNEDGFVVSDLASSSPINAMASPVSLQVNDRGILVAVSDGMGGAQAGEVASSIVLDALRHGMSTVQATDAEAALRVTIEDANKQVIDAALATGRVGMGATLTAVLFNGAYAYIAEIGDSRAYLLRDGRMVQLTHDQSLVQQLIDSGMLTRETSENSQYKNVILQAMGIKPDIAVALNRLSVRRHDRFLVCSDGLSGSLKDQEMLAIILGSATMESACARLIAAAVAHGAQDDVTVILAEVNGEGAPSMTPSERMSFETLKVLNQVEHVGAS